MKIPYNWLKDYVKTDASVEEVAAAVAAIGTEVEEIIYPRQDMTRVVAGKIVKIERHPDADRLVVCQIDVGEEQLQIVTGADNVFEGALVPVAMHGSLLPNGLKIKKGKLRGVESMGMLCSGEELLLKESDWPGAGVDGILILEEAMPGQDMREVLMQNDTVIDFEVGANRADLLCMLGVARETAAALDVPLEIPTPSFTEKGGSIEDYVKVTIDAQDLCPRYMARAIHNVQIAPSPKWMQERLYAAGMRPINNIVDITNFVMLETGQPMHAFDGADITGKHIVVRRANEGECLTTLDGNTHELTDSMLLITDESGPIGIAGIMGGENSEIKPDTKTVVFESAKFMYGNIRQTSRSLGISSESSMRYSKGLDSTTAEYALHRACQLVEELGAGEVVSGEIDKLYEDLAETAFTVTTAQINARLGTQLTTGQMIACLARVGIGAQERETGTIHCVIPRYRMDIFAYADIAEEVARIYGYDNIPESISAIKLNARPMPDPDKKKDALRGLLSSIGYYECQTFSFMGMHELDKLHIALEDKLRKAVTIINPLGDDRGYMRTTLLPAMLQNISYNINQKNTHLRLFEASKVYLPESLPLVDTLPEEHQTLIMAITKDVGDFYALKGDLEKAFDVLGVDDVSYKENEAPYLHPGIRADVCVKGVLVGVIGEVHPDVAENYDLPAGTIVATVDIAMLAGSADDKKYQPIPRFPALERDIAVVLRANIEAANVQACIEANGGKYLSAVRLFDVYQAKALGENMKSLAYALQFRSSEGTLTDDLIEGDMQNILDALQEELGATLRK